MVTFLTQHQMLSKLQLHKVWIKLAEQVLDLITRAWLVQFLAKIVGSRMAELVEDTIPSSQDRKVILWSPTPVQDQLWWLRPYQLWPWRTPALCCLHWAATTLVIMAITLTITGCLQAPTLRVLQTMSTMALALDMLLIQDMSQLIVLNQTHSQLFLSIEGHC